MTVTSTDQEKLLLLDKNTELRRVNKELMRLNEEWNQVYCCAMLRLQKRIKALMLENSAIKTFNDKLLLKVEHQQSVKDFYEQALMQEVKKKQELHNYIRRAFRPSNYSATFTQGNFMMSSSSTSVNPPGGSNLSPFASHSLVPATPSPQAELGGQGLCSSEQGDRQQEIQELKEQLQALQCQIQIYEVEFETERNSHTHTLWENRKLKQKWEDECQQVALLQEQLKVYEEDFKRERSDKQMLQRLLKQKHAPLTSPMLIHRCNTEEQPEEGGKRIHDDRQQLHHPLCRKHQS